MSLEKQVRRYAIGATIALLAGLWVFVTLIQNGGDTFFWCVALMLVVGPAVFLTWLRTVTRR